MQPDQIKEVIKKWADGCHARRIRNQGGNQLDALVHEHQVKEWIDYANSLPTVRFMK